MKRLTAIGMATALALVCGAQAALAGGVLKLGRNDDSTTFDPIKTILNSDIWILNNTNAFLVRANQEANGIIPDLAESWDISDDGLVYTFHLRDAKFSDGSPVTAQDAAFSLTRVRDDPESVQSAVYQIMKSIEAPDDRTVVITLAEPSSPFLATLAMFAAAILPEKVVTELGEDFSDAPVGAGAFHLAEWRRGDVVKLEANEHYWEEGLPKLDGVEWYVVTDDNTRILKVEAGELDGAMFIPFNRVADLEANPDINVHLDPSTREDKLLLNNEHGKLASKNVRQAINMAIDLQSIVDAVTFGHGTVANSYIPAGAMYYNPDNPLYPYDPEKAKAMLEAEGATDISLALMIDAGNKVEEQTAILMKDQLAKVGINVEIEKVDPGQTWDLMFGGDYDMSISYWTNDIIDPDQKSTFSLGMDSNMDFLTRYQGEKAAELVAQGRVELDPDKRRDIYYQLQAIAKEDVPWIDLYYSPFRNISRTNVHDFVQSPLGKFLLETTWVDE
jgi:peptide/nickel transport system substrate-binding protein